MPFSAYLDGERVVSLDFSNEEWKELKKKRNKGSNLILPCCDTRAYQKISHRGTKHFCHWPGHIGKCNWEPESEEHLEIKQLIYENCKKICGDNGVVDIEHTLNGCIADIYVDCNNRKFAFEVQVSRITPHILYERQQKYKDQGVTGIWFYKYNTDNFEDNFPIFQYFKYPSSHYKHPKHYRLIIPEGCSFRCQGLSDGTHLLQDPYLIKFIEYKIDGFTHPYNELNNKAMCPDIILPKWLFNSYYYTYYKLKEIKDKREKKYDNGLVSWMGGTPTRYIPGGGSYHWNKHPKLCKTCGEPMVYYEPFKKSGSTHDKGWICLKCYYKNHFVAEKTLGMIEMGIGDNNQSWYKMR